VREGWIPTFSSPSETALSRFGTCESLIFEVDDSMSIVHQFPPPGDAAPDWQDVGADDDVVLSHGDSLTWGDDESNAVMKSIKDKGEWGGLIFILVLVGSIWHCCTKRRHDYTAISGSDDTNANSNLRV
jgi:hypothetical protein